MTYHGERAPSFGVAAIYLAGVYRGLVNLNSSTNQFKVLLFRSPSLTDAVRVITVSIYGTATGARSGVALDVLAVS